MVHFILIVCRSSHLSTITEFKKRTQTYTVRYIYIIFYTSEMRDPLYIIITIIFHFGLSLFFVYFFILFILVGCNLSNNFSFIAVDSISRNSKSRERVNVYFVYDAQCYSKPILYIYKLYISIDSFVDRSHLSTFNSSQ